MRVLLLSTNRCRSLVPPFPLGLALVAANLDPRRHTVEVWDAMFEDEWESSLRARLRAFRPEAIGLSIRNVDDQEIRGPRLLVEEAREMASVCRDESSAPLVGGGAGFGMFPAEILSYVGLDCGIVGEGERAFPRLLDRLEAGRTPEGIPGAIWRENGRASSTPPDWSQPLEELPPADRTLLDGGRYYEARGTAGIPNAITVQSKRGCPMPCTYCATAAIEGAAIRVRSPQAVVDEVAALAEQGISRIQFVDSLFTHPSWHARAICEEMIRRRVAAHWSATISPEFADPDLLRLMKQAGCALVMVGNESGCSRMLRVLGKGFTREDVERCFSACEREGIHYNAFLLLGAPGEDRESVSESVELVRRYSPALVSVSVGIRLYPGCRLTRAAQEEGSLAAGADLLTPRFALSPAVADWIWDYLEPIMAQDPRWTF